MKYEKFGKKQFSYPDKIQYLPTKSNWLRLTHPIDDIIPIYTAFIDVVLPFL